MPGETAGKTYCPDPLVRTVLVSLIAALTSSTVTSGTTPPLESTTVPRTTPVLEDCPQAGIAERRATSNTPPIAIFEKSFMVPPTTESVCEQRLSSGTKEQTRQK